jgi:hypothetical protein
MALQHSQPLDIIDVRPLGADLNDAVTTSLLKTPTLQLMRLVLRAGRACQNTACQARSQCSASKERRW